MNAVTATDLGALAQLTALLRLVSPALPIGSFAYSRGLEQAVERKWVRDEASARAWISGLLHGSLCRLDGPVLARIHAALGEQDVDRALAWCEHIRASRESRELLLEDEQMGRALLRLLVDLEVPRARELLERDALCFAAGFALAGLHYGIALPALVSGHFYAACESQVSAALRLGALGQTSGQRILSCVLQEIPACATHALWVADEDIGSLAPGLALASAWHETQYSRLFRS